MMLLEWKGFKSVTSTCEEICAIGFPYWAEQLGPQSRHLLLCRFPLLCLKTSMGLTHVHSQVVAGEWK